MDIYIISKNGEAVTTVARQEKTIEQLEEELGRLRDTFDKAELRPTKVKVHVFLGEEDITQDVLTFIGRGKRAAAIDKETYHIQNTRPYEAAYKLRESGSKIQPDVEQHGNFALRFREECKEQRVRQESWESFASAEGIDTDTPLADNKKWNIYKKQGRHQDPEASVFPCI